MILLRHPAVRFTLLLLVAAILRSDTFGDPNLHGDESFYRTVGEAMHYGALPYVDVWDRKPFGLFALFYLIAGISADPLAYQLVATLFAAAAAMAIGAIAIARTNLLGALLAGVCYLLWLAPLQGFGGQSPVFYNLFIAGGALLLWRALPALREGRVTPGVPLAMLLGGMGITLKTTAFFEAAFLGVYAAAVLLQSGAGWRRTLRKAAIWASIGAAPALLIAASYWAAGHWPEFWHAMVTSNLSKPPHWPTSRVRLMVMVIHLLPVLAIAAFGLIEQQRDLRRFTLCWLAAAVLGLFAMPNFYLHYAMPLLVPLCVAAAPFLAKRLAGLAATAALAAMSVWIAPLFQFDHAPRSRAALTALAEAVRGHSGGRDLLLYDAPPQIYRLTGHRFITPLVFPTHLSHRIEKDVSHLSTLAETRRVLALAPGAVVMATRARNHPANEETRRLVLAYVGRHCRLIVVQATPERQRTDYIAVWGDCAR